MTTFIPYNRQWIDGDDIEAVLQVLGSDWLTTGPKVGEFEQAVAAYVGAKAAAAVSSGTGALHAAMHALAIGQGDEVIVPAMTFVATANAVVFQGGTPVFADVEENTLLVDPEDVAAKITPHTRAIIAVDFAGQPCDYTALLKIAGKRHLKVVADACHSLGATYQGQKVGTLADLTVFSFHPVKAITTAEGGMVVADDLDAIAQIRQFRNHGIASDHRQRAESGTFHYEMEELGYNYRISDVQCALGLSQLKKLSRWIEKRAALARLYDEQLAGMEQIEPLKIKGDVEHAYHLYVVRIRDAKPGAKRKRVFEKLRQRGIGANVHYLPVHLHAYYRRAFHTHPGLCPRAERQYERILSLPLFPKMSTVDVEAVVAALKESLS